MSREATARIIDFEARKNRSVEATAVIHVSFSGPNRGKILRQQIVGISGTGPALTIIRPNQASAEITEFPVKKITAPIIEINRPEISPIDEANKTENYNPSKRKKDYLDEMGRRIIRRRRPSRCNGVHDAEADPCGSPRCRTKGRQKLNANRSGNNQQRRQKRQHVILNPRKVTS